VFEYMIDNHGHINTRVTIRQSPVRGVSVPLIVYC
jgi:hypothetical protein